MIGLVDIGGTKLLAGVAPSWGAARAERVVRRPTPEGDAIDALIAMLDEARDGAALEAVACAVPGPFDRARAVLVNPPGMPPAWHGLDLRAGLGARLRCPVVVENDANCAALAEARHGAGAGLPAVVYLTVSTGIGSGVVRDGRVVVTRHDTEGGHVVLWPSWLGGPRCDCGGAGCLEALASGRAITRRFGCRPEELDDQRAWDEVGRWLGLGIVAVAALHDPDAVVLGGGVCAAADRFWPAMTATVEASLHLQPVPLLRRAALDETRNLVGALALGPLEG